jgi:hypothetical protein
VEPLDRADFPYGVSKGTYFQTYFGWIDFQNIDLDFGLVSLDRRQGDRTGWMAWVPSEDPVSLNYSGYPVEQPYVPASSFGQYVGFDPGNVTSLTENRITLDAFTYGGHAGGPAWSFIDGARVVHGVLSTSDRQGVSGAKRLDSGTSDIISTVITEDESLRPPIPRPDLIEYTFPGAIKDVTPTIASPGVQLAVTWNILNIGFEPALDAALDFYLSADQSVSSSDFLIGSVDLGSANAFTYFANTSSFTVPADLPSGTYYLGWVARTSSIEYDTNDNTVVITSKPISISGGASCEIDVYEPNNSSTEATLLGNNSSQSHSICPIGESDWIRFSVAQESAVLLETAGTFGDTRMTLYNSTLSQLAFDDDGGSGLFSRIQKDCSLDPLPPGEYFIEIDEYNDNDPIANYSINLAVDPCVTSPPDIRAAPLQLSFAPPTASRTADPSMSNSLPVRIGSASTTRQPSGLLRLQSGTYEKVDLRAPSRRRGADALSVRHLYVEFHQVPDAADLRALALAGVQVLRYLPDDTYAVAVEASVDLNALNIAGGVKWSLLPVPSLKMARSLLSGLVSPHAMNVDGSVRFQVRLFDDVSLPVFRQQMDGLGLEPTQLRVVDAHQFELSLPLERAFEITGLDSVSWVEEAPPPNITFNTTAAQRVKADELKQPQYGLSGSGIVVGVWDGGAVDSHSDFGTRLTVMDGALPNSHATHVAGTVAGSGGGSSQAEGMAPAALIESYDWNNDTSELRQSGVNGPVTISNHSYGFITGWHWDGYSWIDTGSAGFGLYDSNSAEVDDIIDDTGMLVFKSAGNDRNDGPDCSLGGPRCDGAYASIGYWGNAKNLITVCALNDDDSMTSFSNWGPSQDGRVKPDLCANGSSVVSTDLDNTYSSKSGTSMSSPSAAGTSALLVEHFKSVVGVSPRPDLMKTLMIHGARDIANAGPDYSTGWGIIDAQTSYQLISNGHFAEAQVTAGASVDFSLAHPGGPLKVTLGWTDPAGSVSAQQALVNDLDLILISPTGTVHRPWTLNPALPSQVAVTGSNRRDNVEQVSVTTAEPGAWTAQVSGFSVPIGPQTFSLVSEGLVGSANVETRTFAVFNDGGDTLAVTSISADDGASWIQVAPDAFDVQPGQSVSVNVYVDYASAPTARTVTRLNVQSNDVNEPLLLGGVDVIINDTGCPDDNNDQICDGPPVDPVITRSDTGDGEVYLYVSVDDGGSPITVFTASCTDGNVTYTGSSSSSPIKVTGLTNDVPYICSVTATNSVGTSSASAETAPLIPEAAVTGLPIWLLHEATQ